MNTLGGAWQEPGRELEHPSRTTLLSLLAAAASTEPGPAGHPRLGRAAFELLTTRIPHLFGHGHRLLAWLSALERLSASGSRTGRRPEDHGAIVALRRAVYAAAVCAPPALWLIRQLLPELAREGATAALLTGQAVTPRQPQLLLDLSLLHAAGYLERRGTSFVMADHAAAFEVLTSAPLLPPMAGRDIAEELARFFAGEDELEPRFLALAASPSAAGERPWPADLFELELGFRVVPLVIALRVAGLATALTEAADANAVLPSRAQPLLTLLRHAAYVEPSGRVTALGARVFERAPGPFGIIHAYHPYLAARTRTYPGRVAAATALPAAVARGANIAASQDGNRKALAEANRQLDRFALRHGFEYGVFIEHALGEAEASRQRFARSARRPLRFFGADLETLPIQRAREHQRQGRLPADMVLLSGADLARPELLLEAVAAAGCANEQAVMIVGNGFHEVRGASDERLIEALSAYARAGIVLIFIEETALSDSQTKEAAWNTYHAAFRYTHELSGQLLRPCDDDRESSRASWKSCIARAGYDLFEDFSPKGREVFAFDRPPNPSISMTYFCVPRALARQLRSEPAPQPS